MAEMQEQQEQAKEGSRTPKGTASEKTADTAAAAGRGGMHPMRRWAGETRRGIAETGRAAGQGLDAAADDTRDLAQRTAGQIEDMGERMAEEAERLSGDVRMLMEFPRLASRTLHDMQQSVTRLAGRAMQANFRATQELLHAVSPAALIEVQQRIAGHYVRGVVEGGVEALRSSRRFADEALRPLDQDDGGVVADVMTRDVEIVSPQQTVQEAAKLMAQADTGALPVGENDRLIGMITDRDIALRVIAEGKDARQTRVRDAMTPKARYCFEDEGIADVAETMSAQKLRRMPVLNRGKRLVGIVSLGDISGRHSSEIGGRALGAIARAGDDRNAAQRYAGDKPGRSRSESQGQGQGQGENQGQGESRGEGQGQGSQGERPSQSG